MDGLSAMSWRQAVSMCATARCRRVCACRAPASSEPLKQLPPHVFQKTVFWLVIYGKTERERPSFTVRFAVSCKTPVPKASRHDMPAMRKVLCPGTLAVMLPMLLLRLLTLCFSRVETSAGRLSACFMLQPDTVTD